MQLIVILVVFAAMLALSFAAFNFFGVKKMPEGTERMSEIASAIRVGANAFIEYEYKVLYTVVAVVAVIMAVVTTWHAAVALLIGSIMSGCAGYIGMKIATYANVRVSNKARETKSIGETVKVAFRGGSVMGLCVGHDILFNKHSHAPTTTLVVKDRVLMHNPAAALYHADGYYQNLCEDIGE